MILSQQQIAALRQIIQDASTAVAVSVFGYELPDEEIQRLVDEKWIDAGDLLRLTDDAYLTGAVDEKGPLEDLRRRLRVNPVKLSDVEQRAMDLARNRAGQYCVGLGNRWSDKLGRIVVDADQDLAERTRKTIRDETATAVAERKTRKQLTTKLANATEEWTRDWDRIAATELQTAHQEGFLESTLERHGESAMMARVPDPGACKTCLRLLTKNGKPIVRPLSWWLEQGSSNAGKKQNEWKPVYGPIHPHCRCESIRVPEGFEIDESGAIEPIEKSAGPYIGPRGGKWADAAHTIPWEDSSARTGVIKVDPSVVRVAVEEMIGKQKWHPRREQLVNPDHYPESHLTNVQVTNAAGKEIDVRVVMRPDSRLKDPRGVSGKHHIAGTRGNLSHTIYLEVAPKAWQRSDLASTLRSVLAHELTHASDPGVLASAKPRDARRWKKESASEYYNKPAEITARMQQIYRELNTPAAAKEAREYAELWTDNPGSETASSFLVGHVLNWSETWKEIESHLTPKNRKRILREMSRLLSRHVAGASEPIEKSDNEKVTTPLEGWQRQRKPRLRWRGLTIRLENDEGDIRGWFDPAEGRSGFTLMDLPYGYIERTEGADGDEVDVFVGRDPTAENVFIVHQMKAPDFQAEDEDKVMIGFKTRSQAVQAYLAHYDDPRFLGSVTAMSADEFVRRVTKTNGELIKASVGGEAYSGPGVIGRVHSGGLRIDDDVRSARHVIDSTLLMDAFEQAAKGERPKLRLDLQRFNFGFELATPPRPRPKKFAEHLGRVRLETKDNRERHDNASKRRVEGQRSARDAQRWAMVKR